MGNYEYTVEDREYLRHDDTGYLATIYRPQGDGPFPIVVELHGGAWAIGNRQADKLMHESMAKDGIVVVALDWRLPPVASHPASFEDINYGVRWVKAHAKELGGNPDKIAIMGNSSGGHQAMLTAMRACDARYTTLSNPEGSDADARVNAVILTSPVIDPIGRYKYAIENKDKGKAYAALASTAVPNQDAYWVTQEAMAEAAPSSILDRSEQVEMPPVLYVQGSEDMAHPRPHLERFVETYRKAGGDVDLQLFEGEGQGFIARGGEASDRALGLINAFIHKQLG
jgi:acetyl esterase/lipase